MSLSDVFRWVRGGVQATFEQQPRHHRCLFWLQANVRGLLETSERLGADAAIGACENWLLCPPSGSPAAPWEGSDDALLDWLVAADSLQMKGLTSKLVRAFLSHPFAKTHGLATDLRCPYCCAAAIFYLTRGCVVLTRLLSLNPCSSPSSPRRLFLQVDQLTQTPRMQRILFGPEWDFSTHQQAVVGRTTYCPPIPANFEEKHPPQARAWCSCPRSARANTGSRRTRCPLLIRVLVPEPPAVGGGLFVAGRPGRREDGLRGWWSSRASSPLRFVHPCRRRTRWWTANSKRSSSINCARRRWRRSSCGGSAARGRCFATSARRCRCRRNFRSTRGRSERPS